MGLTVTEYHYTRKTFQFRVTVAAVTSFLIISRVSSPWTENWSDQFWEICRTIPLNTFLIKCSALVNISLLVIFWFPVKGDVHWLFHWGQVKPLCSWCSHISTKWAYLVSHMWILLMLSTLNGLWGSKGAIYVYVPLPYGAKCVYPVPWDTPHSVSTFTFIHLLTHYS